MNIPLGGGRLGCLPTQEAVAVCPNTCRPTTMALYILALTPCMLLSPTPTATPAALHYRHAFNFPGDNGVPGVASAQCGNYDAPYANRMQASSTLYAEVGPNSPSSDAPLEAESFGGCPTAAVNTLDRAAIHVNVTQAGYENLVSAFSFCYAGRGAVFYSQIPMDGYLRVFPDSPLANYHANAISVFTNDIQCPPGPPTCPVDVMVSRSWLPPNKKMTSVNITTVPIQDPRLPGTVEITGITYFDSRPGAGGSVTFPLAAWPLGTSSDATVSVSNT